LKNLLTKFNKSFNVRLNKNITKKVLGEKAMEYKIKELREKRRLSQDELAELSGVIRPTISRLESSDDVETTTGTLEKLAKSLGVSIRTLFLP
jgi:DNA-binding XRE family transcriptional regulator